MAFKIAYCAGHDLQTPGKRVPAYLDANETREWVLNDRVARYFAEAAGQYADIALLRTDEPTGRTFIDIPQRCAAANGWGADVYIDMHHNAGINGGTGGGVVAYCYPGSEMGRQYRDAIYAAVVAAGNLRGNRSQPLQEKAFDSLRLAKAPAVLMEYGFMDSPTDYPIISTDSYAKLVAYATMEAVAQVAGIRKRTPQPGYTQTQFVRQVQQAIGADVDGIPGPQTLSLTPTVSAQRNETHPVVRPLQRYLAALGYAVVGEADGIAGPKFTAAVKEFQKDHQCWTDGEITAGNKTWRELLGM